MAETDTALFVAFRQNSGILPSSYNGATWDRQYNNVEDTALALEADTIATRTSADFTNYNGRTLLVAFVTANKVGITATYTVSLQWKLDGTNYVTIWTAAAAITVNGTVFYAFGPGVADAASAVEALEMIVPRTFRILVTVATADGANNMDTSVFYALGL